MLDEDTIGARIATEQERLTGQPYYSGDHQVDALHDLIPPMRREPSLYGLAPDEEPEIALFETDLRQRGAHCSELLYAVDYARAGGLLPGLLQDLRSASATATGAERERIMALMRETYDNAKRLVYDLGYPDLGLLAVSNEECAALESGDPLAAAVASAVRAWTLTGAGAFDAAYRLLVASADSLEDQSSRRWAVWGWLNLQAALSAARPGDPERAWEHCAAAVMVNAGVPVAECAAHARRRIPWWTSNDIANELTDRSTDPFLRSYLWAYPAGIDWFATLADTTDGQVLRGTLERPLSPTDLAALWPQGPSIGGQ